MVCHSKNMHVTYVLMRTQSSSGHIFFPVLVSFIAQDDVMFSLYIKTYKSSSYNLTPNVSLTLGLF